MSAVIVPIVPAIALKRILFTTDFTDVSQKALPIVSAIAHRYGSRVFVAHVWTPGPYPMVSPEAAAVLDRQSERAAKQELERISQSRLLNGIKMEPTMRCGEPAEEIGRLVEQLRIDLAVMSTHGHTGFRHRVLGSVAEEVVRTLRCPVLTVGPRLAAKFANIQSIDNILFPTDFSAESMAVFPYLASLAHEYCSRLIILHVLATEAREQKEVVEQVSGQMKQALAKEISPRCQVEFVIDYGDPAGAILVHARRIGADVIGLGVRGWTDIAKHFRETVAYRILADAECPVLTHRGRY
jgi:nucleotide-binding universal stress UspA family protein